MTFMPFFYYFRIEFPITLIDASLFEVFALYSFENQYVCFGSFFLVDFLKMVPRVTENFLDCRLSLTKFILYLTDPSSYFPFYCNDIDASDSNSYSFSLANKMEYNLPVIGIQ